MDAIVAITWVFLIGTLIMLSINQVRLWRLARDIKCTRERIQEISDAHTD